MKPTKPIYWATKKPARKATAKRRDLEGPVQKAVLREIRELFPDVFVAHVPNGGMRNARVAAQLKAQGVVRGVPDLMLIPLHGRVGFIEVKAPGGSLTPEQKEFRDMCAARDIFFAVIDNAEQVEQCLKLWVTI